MNVSMTLEEDVMRMRDEVLLLNLQKVVLVEGKSDVLFWGNVLSKFCPNQFEIYPYINYPSFESSSKSALMKHYSGFVDKDFIICVDSDYDYLLRKETINHPFIFHTYVHSVESYQCYAPSLPTILQTFLDTEGSDFDFVDLMARYSSIIYPLLVYSLFSMHTDGEFDADNCSKEIGFEIIRDINADLENLLQKVKGQCVIYGAKYDLLPEFIAFKESILALGLTEQNAYLFIRGHDLLDKVVVKFLINIANPLRRAEFDRRKEGDDKEKLAQYNEHLKKNNFWKLLKNNTNFTDCVFFQKIENDLRTAFRVE